MRVLSELDLSEEQVFLLVWAANQCGNPTKIDKDNLNMISLYVYDFIFDELMLNIKEMHPKYGYAAKDLIIKMAVEYHKGVPHGKLQTW